MTLICVDIIDGMFLESVDYIIKLRIVYLGFIVTSSISSERYFKFH